MGLDFQIQPASLMHISGTLHTQMRDSYGFPINMIVLISGMESVELAVGDEAVDAMVRGMLVQKFPVTRIML